MNKIMMKKIKTILLVLVLVFSVFGGNISTKVFAQSTTDKAVEGIQSLSDAKHGLIPCDPYSDVKSEQCSPKDAIKLMSTLANLFIYITVIALVVMVVISGVGYVYSGNSAQYLAKWKKRIKNSVIALLIIVVAMGLVLGILAAIGMRAEVLQFLQGLLANTSNTSFGIFNHAAAQDISDIVDSTVTDDGVGYTNFFPNQTIPSLILLSVKFLVNYVAAPALVAATIWAGFLFVRAQGSSEKIQKAKKFATRVVIGIIVAAAASLAIGVLLNTLNDVADQTKVDSSSVTTTTE